MRLGLAVTIGIAGIIIVALIALVAWLGNFFSPFIFAAWLPFIVLIMLGKTNRKKS